MIGNPLAILHVLAPAEFGGLETVVKSLALGHTATGHCVEIAAVLDRQPNRFVEEARDAGLRVHVIDAPPRSIIPERRGVRALLTQRRRDVVHTHGYRSDILDIGIARQLGVPTTTTLHGFSGIDRKAHVYEWLQLRAARRASAIVAVSSNVAQRIIASGVPRQLVHLIRNATKPVPSMLTAREARDHLQLNRGVHVGWVGRLSSEKGPDIALSAMALLTDLPITLSFIGDGADRSMLEARASHLNVSGSVRFHGNISNAAALLSAFDLIVLSSRTEGTPIVVLEAMAAGVPIVATSVGGIPDMLTPADALLVPPEDASALASAVRMALEDPGASAVRATRAAARLASEFDLQAWLSRYETLYRSIQPSRKTF